MTARRGIPASEEAELLGGLRRADDARAVLTAIAAHFLREMSDPAARRQWLRDRSGELARHLPEPAASAVRRSVSAESGPLLTRARAASIPGRAVAIVLPAAAVILLLRWRSQPRNRAAGR